MEEVVEIADQSTAHVVAEEIDTEAELEVIPEVEPLTLISGLLFVSPRPISFERLQELSELSTDQIESVLEEVKQLYRDDVHGFSLHEVSGGFQFRSAPRLAGFIKRMVPSRTKRLSRAAGETLAVIAYKQPVERAEIESIRGVDALPTLKTLLDARLIRVIGKHDSPGHPVLYGTTAEFLERFGLSDLSALPTLHEFEQLAAEPVDTEPADAEPIEAETGEAESADNELGAVEPEDLGAHDAEGSAA